MDIFLNFQGKPVLLSMIRAVQDNKDYLSEVDGLIGDGDHGVNMNKGFTRFEQRISNQELSFTQGLHLLSEVLMGEIGGSMGPIYGTLFEEMAVAGEHAEKIGLEQMNAMLQAGLKGVQELVPARVGDKTLVDTLEPAAQALDSAARRGETFETALAYMKEAARNGRDSTKNMVAVYGRSSRLGKRSQGVLDAGAVSCCLILEAMADGILSCMLERMES